MEGAILNVATNLDSIKDDVFVAERREEITRLFKRGTELRAEMWQVARGKIRSLPT